VCQLCGVKAAHWSDEPLAFELRDGSYQVPGFTYEHCDACGENTFKATQADEILRVAVAAARTDLGRLSSEEIHELRHTLGLTQAGLEAQLGVGTGTVGRWERGTVLQGATADRLMRILWAHPELLQESGVIAREGRGPYRKRAE
jgi:putative zinc finger/helix-turn-helix YgiT family protein